MRHYLAFVLSLILLACAADPKPLPSVAPSPTKADVATVADNLRSTVILLRSGSMGPVCAGTQIDGGVLTAAHCVQPAAGCKRGECVGTMVRMVEWSAWVSDSDEDDPMVLISGEAVAVDHDLDLAFIRTKQSRHTPIGAAVEVGDAVYSIGHPDGQLYTIASGFVVAGNDDDLRVSIPVWGGSSGGGLFDHDGRLIGVASRMQVPNERLYSAVALFTGPDAISRFLRRLPAG